MPPGPLAGRVTVTRLSELPPGFSAPRAVNSVLACYGVVGLNKADKAGSHLSGGKEVIALTCVSYRIWLNLTILFRRFWVPILSDSGS